MKRFARWARLAPLTLAVAAGPLIDVAQGVASTTDDSHVGQIARGILAVGLLLALRRRTATALRLGLVLPLLVLAGYALLQGAAIGAARDGLVFATRVAFLALVFLDARQLAAQRIIGPRWPGFVAWVALLSILASQAVGWMLGVTSIYEGTGGLPGVAGQPATTAAAACAILPLFALRTPISTPGVIGLAIAATSILATQRRSALLAAAIGLTLYGARALFSGRWRTTARVGILFGAVAAAALAVATFTPTGTELAHRFADLDFERGGTASGRTEFQATAARHALTRDVTPLLFGEGPGALPRLLAVAFGSAIGAHNDWIDVAYAFGLAGLGLIAWFYARLAALALRLDPALSATMMMAAAALAVLGATAGGALDPTAAPTFAAFGLLASRARRRRFSVQRQPLPRPRPEPSMRGARA